jgi:hypothetical protein
MSQHKKDNWCIKTDIPEVARFAECLNGVIRERTSHNRLVKAAGIGNGKLATYLSGEHVPDWRVVEHYILRTLAGFTPAVQPEEVATLRRRHQQACAIQDPRLPTYKDQIAFLEQDLDQAWAKRAEVQRRLDEALQQNASSRERADELADVVTHLRQQVEALTTEHVRLERELASVKQEYGEVSRCKGRMIIEGQQKIAHLEQAMRDQHRTLDELQREIDRHEQQEQLFTEHTLYLRLQIGDLHKQVAEQARLFMKLIAHQQNKPLVQALNAELGELAGRLARHEKTIAQLTQTNALLTAELDRVTAERDFIRATPLPGLPSVPQLAPPPGADNPTVNADPCPLTYTGQWSPGPGNQNWQGPAPQADQGPGKQAPGPGHQREQRAPGQFPAPGNPGPQAPDGERDRS